MDARIEVWDKRHELSESDTLAVIASIHKTAFSVRWTNQFLL